jgi:hypothetical protein
MGRHCLKGVGEIARAALARRHATVAERIDHVARDLAHELFSRDCWAFTGEGMKPHSADCEAAYQRISATLTSYAKGLHQP